ncbi:sigma-70 family RNA polymerase sigma factor, partial [Flavivirga sp. 57AJ16]|uniref:sigma-70 family RNA polymerase sigma factor n=1 Tax=Flavivirga sp. 57AJ16 TaxID=3025307 RepID=UPI002365FCD4
MRQDRKYRLTQNEFEDIFERLYDPLCLFAHRYVGDLGLSEDIVQDVFTKVLAERTAFPDKDKVEGFFYTAVKNRSLDVLRSKYARDVKARTPQDLEALQSGAYFLWEAVTIETSGIIEKAIRSLPDRCAEAIRLSMEDCPNREIAEKMGISVHTVKEYKKTAYK